MYQNSPPSIAPAIMRATVLDVRRGVVLLESNGERREATLAVAYPYTPSAGDEVLALCGEESWIVGVLRAQEPMRFHVNGSLTIEASGPLKITSAQSLELSAPLCRVSAGRFETLAQVAVQKVFQSYSWVRGLYQVFAGRHRTVVDGEAVLRATHIRHFAEKDVKIDGQHIKLG